jgi:hypothetical protein
MFAVTSVDDILILALFFGQALTSVDGCDGRAAVRSAEARAGTYLRSLDYNVGWTGQLTGYGLLGRPVHPGEHVADDARCRVSVVSARTPRRSQQARDQRYRPCE